MTNIKRQSGTMTYVLTDNCYLLCPVHARRWRNGGNTVGMRPALASEVEEQGGVCIDCQDFGPPVVASIRVGGEAHCVQYADGTLLEKIVASEQCGGCGSTGDDGSQAPFLLRRSGGSSYYTCERCGTEYRIGRTSDTETVF